MNGSSISTEKITLQPNNDNGRVELSALKIPFDGNADSVKFIDAALVQDGQEIHVSPQQVTVSEIPGSSPGVGGYKLLTIPFSGVRTDGTVWYTIEHRSIREPIVGEFSNFMTFGKNMIEKQAVTTIKSQIPLYYSVNNPGNAITVTTLSDKAPYIYEVRLNKTSYTIKMEDYYSHSYGELKNQLPAVHFTSSADWKSVSQFNKRFYEFSAEEMSLPELTAAITASRAIKGRLKSDVERVLLWMAENVTYSGRWVMTDSGWQPRDLKTIMSTKVGDCKDYAKLFIALLKKMNIEAEPVYVNADGTGLSSLGGLPIDEANPLPTIAYFNHVIVRYKKDGQWITIDPGRRLGDPDTLPANLRNAWAMNIFEGTPAYRLSTPDANYAKVTIKNTYEERPDGSLMGKSSIMLEGEIANLLKSTYFSQGEQELRELAQRFLPIQDGKTAQLQNVLMVMRNSNGLIFNYEFPVPHDKDGYRIDPPLFLARFPPVIWSHLSFPTEISQESEIPGYFAKNELKDGCFIRGPAMNVDRRVENTDKGVVIHDRATNHDLFNVKRSTAAEKDIWSSHVGSVASCGYGGLIAMEKKDPNNSEQKSFISQIDFTKPYIYDSSNHSSEVSYKGLREIEARIEKSPSDVVLLQNKSLVVEDLGYMYSSTWIPENLEEATNILQAALKLDPQNVETLAMLGTNYSKRGMLKDAMHFFNQGYKIDPNNYRILMSGGDILQKQKQYQQAEGYWKASVLHTKTNADKKKVLGRLAHLYCDDLNRCKDSLPLYDEMIALDPKDAWLYNNASYQHRDAEDYDKAIEYAHQALKLMDFGMAHKNLSLALLSKVRSVTFPNNKDNPNLTGDEYRKLEPLMVEAYKNYHDSGFILSNMAVFYAQLAARCDDDAAVKTSDSYFNELKAKFPDKKDAINWANKSRGYNLSQRKAHVKEQKTAGTTPEQRVPAQDSQSKTPNP